LSEPIIRRSGDLDGRDLHIGIVVSRWNSEITNALLDGALRALETCAVAPDRITVAEVPGAMEIPVVAEGLVSSGVDAVIALGCVIKGETAHFDHVSRTALDGIAALALRARVPVTCGILTTYTVEQAEARSGLDDDNAGSQAALAAIEVANLLRSFREITYAS